MKPLLVVVRSAAGSAHARLAGEALRDVASRHGHTVKVEFLSPETNADELSAAEIAEAEVVVIAADQPVARDRFVGKRVIPIQLEEAIRRTDSVIAAALGEPETLLSRISAAKNLIAITACPTGIAHTFMAAEALKKGAAALGHAIRVETQGSVGAKNALTPMEIAAADAVIIAADTKVDLSRFAGKRLYHTSTKEALHDARGAIQSALATPTFSSANKTFGGEVSSMARGGEKGLSRASKPRTGPYKHLMTGVSHMLPVVTAGGLAIALAFAVGGIYAGKEVGSFGAALSQIGGAAFGLMVAVLAGYIAYSIADRPGLAPGLVGGILANQLGSGFLGGIAAGFLAGYLTRFLANRLRLPATLEGLKPVLILPLFGCLGVGLLMIYFVAPPVKAVLTATTAWLEGMRGTNAAALGLILGAMMAFDMGGPINKAAYTFGVGLLASNVTGPMAAVMAAGMTPPLGLAIAAVVLKTRFDADERKMAGAAFVLGLSFITEGAIPYAAKDPLRVIPALMLGSATAGALSMYVGAQLVVPHGGLFVLFIPGAVAHLGGYCGAIITGSIVTVAALLLLKRPVDVAPAL